MFMDLTKTDIRSGELYLEAAQSKTRLKAPASEIRVLLDSAIVASKDAGVLAGNYYLARGQFLDEQGEYRSALADYNQYDSIARPVNPEFFYTRYKCETRLRMWQPPFIPRNPMNNDTPSF